MQICFIKSILFIWSCFIDGIELTVRSSTNNMEDPNGPVEFKLTPFNEIS